MIVDKGGRQFSRLTSNDLQTLLEAEWKNLSDEEKTVLQLLLDDFTSNKATSAKPALVDHFATATYKAEPVSMEQFVYDEYYLGDTCDKIFPVLLQDLTDIFDYQYKEIIFTGAIGTGKTFVSSVGMCRVLYELSNLQDPQAAFGLTPDTPIVLAGISANEDLAKEVVLKNIVGKIAASPYFREHYPFKITQKNIRFPNNVIVVARATTPQSMLGMSVLAAIVDESNFMPERKGRGDKRNEVVNMAEVIYNNVKRRMFSRYGNRGKLFLPSSKSTVDSFLSGRINAAREDPSIFVRDYALWDVKPDDFSDETFPVLCGNETLHSQILTEEAAAVLEENLPERTVLIRVPTDLKKAFESDLEGSIRDMAGVATVAISPFIQRVGKIRSMADLERQHPFSVEILDPSLGGTFIPDLMVNPVRERNLDGSETEVSRPILNPRSPRHVHIDPALKGCAAGLAMAHVSGWVDIERRTERNEIFTLNAPRFVVDFILKIVPPTGGELDFGIYEALILELAAIGYPIQMVTADQWQSEYVLQRLGKKGMRVDKISMDRTWEPYQHLKLALYEDRVSCYPYKPVMQELQSLEADWSKRKVLKPMGGSKDVSDALAGVLYSLMKFQAADPIPMMKGLSYYGDPGSMSLGTQAMGGLIPVAEASRQASPGFGGMLLPMTSNSDWGDDQ